VLHLGPILVPSQLASSALSRTKLAHAATTSNGKSFSNYRIDFCPAATRLAVHPANNTGLSFPFAWDGHPQDGHHKGPSLTTPCGPERVEQLKGRSLFLFLPRSSTGTSSSLPTTTNATTLAYVQDHRISSFAGVFYLGAVPSSTHRSIVCCRHLCAH